MGHAPTEVLVQLSTPYIGDIGERVGKSEAGCGLNPHSTNILPFFAPPQS